MHDHVFILKPSSFFLLSFGLLVFATFTIIMSLDQLLYVKLLLSLSVFLYGFFYCSHTILQKGQKSIHTLERRLDGKWCLHTKSEVIEEADLLGDSTMTRWILILRFSVPGQWTKKTCIIFKDALSKEAFRQLFVLIKMY